MKRYDIRSDIFFLLGITLACAFTNSLNAQQTKSQQNANDSIKQLESLLLHDDPRLAVAAYRAIESLSNSSSSNLQTLATSIKENFQREAFQFLEKRAVSFKKIRRPTNKTTERSDRKKLHETGYEIVLNDDAISPKHLAYLATINITMLVIVDMPSVKDEHLAFLQGQDDLYSMTLENTGVTGAVFKNLELPGLNVLFLTGSPVNDAGFRTLKHAAFPQLTDIIVVDTEVSAHCVARHRKANPFQVRIRSDQ